VPSKEKRKADYNWENLIREIKRIRSGYNRASKTKYVRVPLILKKKEYAENCRIIERGIARWECIRRNKRFITLYKKNNEILRLGKNIQLTPDITKDNISKDIGKIKTRKNKDGSVSFLNKSHENKYTAYFLFLKNLGHSEFLNNSSVKSQQLHALVYDVLDKKDISKFSQEEIYNFIDQIPKQVDLVIDLGYSKQEIMVDFEKQIDRWLTLYEAIGDRNTKRALDYANINRYLKVYDLKNSKSKPTFSDIAERLYPGPSNKNLDSAIQQVKREYKRAKELINGGFVFIK